MDTNRGSTSQSFKENVPPAPTSSYPIFDYFSLAPPGSSINFSVNDSFQGYPHLHRYFGNKITTTKTANNIGSSSFSNQPETSKASNDKLGKTKPRCHVCGTPHNSQKCRPYELKSYNKRIMEVLKHFGKTPGTFLVQLLSPVHRRGPKDLKPDEKSVCVQQFYNEGVISRLLSTWVKDESGKMQVLGWISGEGAPVVASLEEFRRANNRNEMDQMWRPNGRKEPTGPTIYVVNRVDLAGYSHRDPRSRTIQGISNLGVFVSLQQALDVAESVFIEMYGLTGEEEFSMFTLSRRRYGDMACYDFVPNQRNQECYVRVQEQKLDMVVGDGKVSQTSKTATGFC